MSTSPVLEVAKTTLTLLELIEKAAAQKGLERDERSSKARSKPIITCPLDEKTVAHLSKGGIKRNVRNDGIITLSADELPGYWNIKKEDTEQITLSVSFNVEVEKRGVVLYPFASGPFVSPIDAPTNFLMFKLLAQVHPEAPPVIHELAKSEGSIVVTWTELGLGGIRRLSDLFIEFRGRNEHIDRLAKNHLNPFNPVPYPPSWEQAPKDEIFVLETGQPAILEGWREQLESFCDNLALP